MNIDSKANEIINKLAGFPVGKFKDLVVKGLKEAYEQGRKDGKPVPTDSEKEDKAP